MIAKIFTELKEDWPILIPLALGILGALFAYFIYRHDEKKDKLKRYQEGILRKESKSKMEGWMMRRPGPAVHSTPVELFGVTLKNATRYQLRAAFSKSHLRVVREKDNYWVDLYDSNAALEGSSQLSVGYSFETGRFAFAEYTFPMFKDTVQAQKIVNMVTWKYGSPETTKGRIQLDEIEAVWKINNDVSIKVYSDCPGTTSYLRYSDPDEENRMEAEKEAEARRKAGSQSHAF